MSARKKSARKKARSKKVGRAKSKARKTRGPLSDQAHTTLASIRTLRELGKDDLEIAAVLGISREDVEGIGGRGNPVPINIALLRDLCRIHCSMSEIAMGLGMSEATLHRKRKERPELVEFMDAAFAEGNITLRRWQMAEARNGNPTMLIWLGKQRLGQQQNPEPQKKRSLDVRIRYDEQGDEARERHRKRLAKKQAEREAAGS